MQSLTHLQRMSNWNLQIKKYWRNVDVHRNTYGFLLPFSFTLNVYRERTECGCHNIPPQEADACCYEIVLKHHLPPVIPVLILHMWAETNVGYKPHIPPWGNIWDSSKHWHMTLQSHVLSNIVCMAWEAGGPNISEAAQWFTVIVWCKVRHSVGSQFFRVRGITAF